MVISITAVMDGWEEVLWACKESWFQNLRDLQLPGNRFVCEFVRWVYHWAGMLTRQSLKTSASWWGPRTLMLSLRTCQGQGLTSLNISATESCVAWPVRYQTHILFTCRISLLFGYQILLLCHEMRVNNLPSVVYMIVRQLGDLLTTSLMSRLWQ